MVFRFKVSVVCFKRYSNCEISNKTFVGYCIYLIESKIYLFFSFFKFIFSNLWYLLNTVHVTSLYTFSMYKEILNIWKIIVLPQFEDSFQREKYKNKKSWENNFKQKLYEERCVG